MQQLRQKLKRAQRKRPERRSPRCKGLTTRVWPPAPSTRNARDKGPQAEQRSEQQNQDQGAAGKVAEARLPQDVGPASRKGEQLAKETGWGRAGPGSGQRHA